MPRRTGEQNVCVVETGKYTVRYIYTTVLVTFLVAVTKVYDKSNLRKSSFGSQFEGQHSSREGKQTRARGWKPHWDCSQEAERDEFSAQLASSFSSLYETGTLFHRKELYTFRVSLPSSVKLFLQINNTHTKYSLLGDFKTSNDGWLLIIITRICKI